MLKPEAGPVQTFAFLLAVQIEENGLTSEEQVLERLKGSLYWMEGIGEVEAESLGIVTMYPEALLPDVQA